MHVRRLVPILIALGALAPAARAASYPVAPTATTSTASSIGATTATLRGSVNPGGATTSYHFDWGTTAAYGHTTSTASAGSGTSAVAVSAKLSSLAPGTTYHFRLVATRGSTTVDGQDATFQTTPPAAPAVSTGGAALTSRSSAELTGSVTPRGHTTTYSFQYGPTSAYGSQTAPTAAGNGTGTVTARAAITGLQPQATYHYRLVATSAGGTTYGADRALTTPSVFVNVSTARLAGHRGYVAPSGLARFGIACIGGTTRCTGTITLLRGSRVIGRGRFGLAAQSAAATAVRLSRAGRRLVHRHRRPVGAVAVVTMPGRAPVTVTVVLVRASQ